MGRFVVVVIDSCGAGELPDAAAYGDAGANTLANCARKVGGLELPVLQSWGLGNVTAIDGCPPAASPKAAFGRMAEQSQGKDTTTGHWEMMGVLLEKGFTTFPQGFPPQLLDEWLRLSGAPGYLGNKTASGTVILDELGEEHLKTGHPIVYTSADSVFQIAAHEEKVPLKTLYAWCEAARAVGKPYGLARVIARPFVGPGAGQFKRTYNRHDFSQPPPRGTVLDLLADKGVRTVGVGKIPDIYDNHGIAESVHTEGNADGLRKTADILGTLDSGFLFVNLVDTDMLYGHRRDPGGYAGALREIDAALPGIAARLRKEDLLVLTADHGNDPTFPGTDHTREYVPLIAHAPGRSGADLGVRESFCDLGATVAEYFGVRAPRGRSFLGAIG
ncbi:MAG TPA: phosphopentomutase [Myxococcales bacterium]|jgi:phosphopentomutase|nr:phosphopentomutase [Myxococcales bacterium]